MTWDIVLLPPEVVDVRWKTEPTGFSSGIKWTFSFKRQKNFMMKYFVGPSIILIILSYSTFFLSSGNSNVNTDTGKAAARVIFCTTNILLSIAILVSTNAFIPQVPI